MPCRDACDDREVFQQRQVCVGGDVGDACVAGGCLLVEFLVGTRGARIQHGADLVGPRIAPADLRCVQLDELFGVGAEPPRAIASRQAQHIGESSCDDPFQVVASAEFRCAPNRRLVGEQRIDGVEGSVVLDLALGQPRHPHTDQTSSPRPGGSLLSGAHRAGQDEPATSAAGVGIHSPLHRTDDLRRLLPFVDDHRALAGRKDAVWVLTGCLSRSRHRQVDHNVGEPASRCRLAAAAGA